MAKPIYGGWVTFPPPSAVALIKYKFVNFYFGKRLHEKNKRKYGYDVDYLSH